MQPLYRFVYRNVFRFIDAELIHDVAVRCLQAAGAVPPIRSGLHKALAPHIQGMSIRALGLDFEHPLGLAAGFDKDACCLPGLSALGFSSVEIGTVTPHPQTGNPRKRIFRLLDDDAFINRMGFPSAGMRAVEDRLAALRKHSSQPIGISLGKNKDTPLPDAYLDYSAVLRTLYPYGDFFVVNVSSPNTPELRRLQTREHLEEILVHLRETVHELTHPGVRPKPLLIKIAPDLTWEEIDTVLDLIDSYGIEGIIATNTTIGREGLRSRQRDEAGGVSGRPLRERSTDIIRHIYKHTEGQLCIVGVGGIFTGDDIWEKMTAGATLVQAYTGFIYQGPTFVRNCMARLRQRLDESGARCLQDMVGSGT